MSLETEKQSTMDHHAETNSESQKKLKFSYSRDFLLSLRELDVCKKLPTGFDQSLISEFEDASQDRQRISGSLSLHGLRRNEYGSSPPTRGEQGNYSRGINGKWDSRSSGRGDRDGDSQSDWDSDSGKRYGNQSKRSWQVPEHDGLLGSGSFPQSSGYASGASASKFRSNDHYQLNRSNEPYQPPRPYKAVPHTRRDTHDSYNDETFGSSECTSEDRAVEERKRRASFELFRKQQQKEFLDNQKINPERHKDDFDISELLEDSKDEKGHLNRSKEPDELAMSLAPENDSGKSSLPLQTLAARPLVPPGFTSTILEKKFGTKPSIHSDSSQVGSSEIKGSLVHVKGTHPPNGTSDILLEKQSKQHAEQLSLSEQQHGSTSITSANSKSEENIPSLLDLDVSNMTVMGSRVYKSSNLSEAIQASENSEVIEFDPKKQPVGDIVGESNQDIPTSVLDKIFGSALTLNGGGSTSFIENNKVDETRAPGTVHSSKFASWFLEEERKPVEDLSSARSNDLLSIIQGSERGGAQGSDVATKNVRPSVPFQSPKLADRHVASSLSSRIENSEQAGNVNNINKPVAVPAVLTCEDLEKSILSESSEKVPTLLLPVQGWSIPDEKTEQQKGNIDDQASHHLLSLLQKGTGMKDLVPSVKLDFRSMENLQCSKVADSIDNAPHDSKEVKAENAPSSGKTLTLEALFGSAFMQELESVGAPASFQNDSMVSTTVDLLESNGLLRPVKDDGLLSSMIHVGSNTSDYKTNIFPFTQREHMKSDGIGEHLLGFDDHRTVPDSSQRRAESGSKLGGFDVSADIGLPEEDSLIAVSDPVSLQNFMPVRNSVKAELLPAQEAPVDIAEKLAALRPVVGGQEGPLFLHGPYDKREPDIPFHNLNVQPSSLQLHPPQLNHAGPFSHPPNVNSQMKFMAPEGIMHHDTPPNHQFPANMLRPPVHHPSSGLTGFDPPLPHPMLQQMHSPGNFPHLQQGLPGSAPLPPYSNNPLTSGFMQEMNPMQGFPFSRRQPNFPDLGIPSGPDVGGMSSHPEALQRLIGMELRSNPKQIHSFGGSGHSQGMYGHELDMGFRYR